MRLNIPLIILLIALTGWAIGCSNNGDSGSISIVDELCEPIPIAKAPDIELCPNADQAKLEEAVMLAGGGCQCNSSCPFELISDNEDGSYSITCINDCGTVTAVGDIKYSQWLSDWDEAQSKARLENKPIMISFYTDLCPACKRLDKNTFSDKEVAARMCQDFVSIKNYAGKDRLFMNYGISSVPITVFTMPDGAELGRIIGYYPPESFLIGLSEVIDMWNQIQSNQ